MKFPTTHEHSPDDDLTTYCADPPVGHTLSGAQCPQKIVKLSDRLVVKFGIGVTKEANNQRRADELVDHAVVRIPSLCHFFADKQGLGYIIMEYLKN